MNFELTEETLEEGRVALHQLERQLSQRNNINDSNSASSSKHNSTTSERKILDQIPRTARLNLRLESLGLTVEELEDRGLLDGGGAVPSYYTSMKQKGRRVLELQSRQHRLLERGKESLTKILDGVFHMVRTLVARGLPLEEYCRQRDQSLRGLMHKKAFYIALKSIGLPFSGRELLDVSQHYLVPSSDHVDYCTFLKDARVYRGGPAIDMDSVIDVSRHTAVLVSVKRMLTESIRHLNKHPDDVYRMFARWDTNGTGTVTATQFLRVLAKLHISLAEVDQDFLVELLDTNARGRIDFESLLSYCFNELDGSPIGGGPGSPVMGNGLLVSAGDDTLSAVSTDGNNSVEQKSTHRRPHTASLSRPYHEAAPHANQTNLEGLNVGQSSVNLPGLKSNDTTRLTKMLQRPLTASAARVSSNTSNLQSLESRPQSRQQVGLKPVGADSNQRTNMLRQRQLDVANHNSYVKELPDDAINDEDGNYYRPPNFYDQHTAASKSPTTEQLRRQSYKGTDLHDGANSFNDATQLTGEDFYYGEQQSTPKYDASGVRESPRERSADSERHDHSFPFDHDQRPFHQPYSAPPRLMEIEDVDSQSVPNAEPIDHLVLLANQILTALREIIVVRYRRGKSLQEIFMHFDRDSKGYFDVGDFVRAAGDLRIETSERVGAIAVRQMAIDGVTAVSFGEFKVFVLDSDHHLLQRHVQEQVASLLEQEGRGYERWMVEVFWKEESALNDSRGGERNSEFISKQAFVSGLHKIGTNLTPSEVTRLVDRFDVHGLGACNLTRFVRMVQSSAAWVHAERLLLYQDEAVEEAQFLRQQLKNGRSDVYPNLSEELIGICEYLGIRVLSEQNMLWIASDALKAPLPVSWTAQKDQNGRTYFYNHLSNQARWEHPLDPHFRKLRDKYRQSSTDYQSSEMQSGADLRGSSAQPVLLNGNRPPQLTNFPSTYNPQAAGSEEPVRPRPKSGPSSSHIPTLVHHPRTEPTLGTGSSRPASSKPHLSSDKGSQAAKPRPFSAPNVVDAHTSTSAPLQQNPGASQTRTEASKAIVESIYSTPFLKTPVLPVASNRLFAVDERKDTGGVSMGERPSSALGRGGSIPIHSGFNPHSSSSNAANKSRPSSSSASRKGVGSTLSAVERAVNYGRNVPSYLLPKSEVREKQAEARAAASGALDSKSNSRFAKLLEVDMVGRLDDIISQHRGAER